MPDRLYQLAPVPSLAIYITSVCVYVCVYVRAWEEKGKSTT